MAPASQLPPGVTAAGDIAVLDGPTVGLLCSLRCPGAVILKLYDLARALRDAGIVVIGGFQSPMEQECLNILLRGSQPVVVCLARHRTITPAAWRAALSDRRLLVLMPSEPSSRRMTSADAQRRNELVANLAGALLIAHASPGGKTDALARQALTAGKPVFTLDDPSNADLVALGAMPVTAATVALEFARLAQPG